MDIHLNLPAAAVRYFYAAVIAADLVFVLMTAASDLGITAIHPAAARHFDLKNEGVLAVWYSSTLLLLNCVACVLVACGSQAGNIWRAAWLLVACGFMALSADETAQLHEAAGRKLDELGLGASYVPKENVTFNWLVLAVPIAGAFGGSLFVAAKSWAGIVPRSRSLALAGMACWVGVLAAEFVESQLVRYGIRRSLQGATEEGLELAGATLFLIALVESLRARPAAGTRGD